MSFSFRRQSYFTTTAFGDSLTDRESESRSLHKVVEFDKTLEYGGLFLFGNAGTRVFAIEVKTILRRFVANGTRFLTIAHLDMSFVGIFHGIGHKVGQYLLDASFVERGLEGRVDEAASS